MVFIRRQGNQIVPCSPNKIRLSKLTTLGPGKRMSPYGFQTLPKSKLAREVAGIDRIIQSIEGVTSALDESVAGSAVTGLMDVAAQL